uniref:Uncharacterized protein n=1 Tax=Meloidogyne enterolobii TaxID=390850 RepID=A0A6V7WEA7_MELEN|nr:unnamed protein product [Meloidogyne enterolobii]
MTRFFGWTSERQIRKPDIQKRIEQCEFNARVSNTHTKVLLMLLKTGLGR